MDNDDKALLDETNAQIEGGFGAWKEAGLPVEQPAPHAKD